MYNTICCFFDNWSISNSVNKSLPIVDDNIDTDSFCYKMVSLIKKWKINIHSREINTIVLFCPRGCLAFIYNIGYYEKSKQDHWVRDITKWRLTSLHFPYIL